MCDNRTTLPLGAAAELAIEDQHRRANLRFQNDSGRPSADWYNSSAVSPQLPCTKRGRVSKASSSYELTLSPCPPEQTLTTWLYGELRRAILDGRLATGNRLPASRDFAVQYGLSRGTVVSVFERLQAEGYVSSRVGSGTCVNRLAPANEARTQHRRPPAYIRRATAAYVRPKPWTNLVASEDLRPFGMRDAAVDKFPAKLWGSIAAKRARSFATWLRTEDDGRGYRPLREAITHYLSISRGVRCSPDQVLIVSGIQQALDLVARVLLSPGEPVWMEDPGYFGASIAFGTVGARIIPVPVDEQGLDVSAGIKLCQRAKGAYVTPAHQFPLGMTLSLERRMALLAWAARTGAFVIEDDYDSEYRFEGRPVPALQGLDENSNVILVGSFSKLLFPALRIGYVVAPAPAVDLFRAFRYRTDFRNLSLDQAVLADFISAGHLGRHLSRMRNLYAGRLAALREGGHQYLRGLLEISDVRAGLYTVGFLANGMNSWQAEKEAAARGVEVIALDRYTLNRPDPKGLLLGFGAFDESTIRKGLLQLAAVLERPTRSRRVASVAKRSVLLLGLLACLHTHTASAQLPPAPYGTDWEGYNKLLDAQRFSPLDQINAANVAKLVEVCRVPLAAHGTFEPAPVVIGDSMFVTTPTDTFAIDPVSCKIKWRHSYHRSEEAMLQVNRGVAYLNGRVFRGTDDARLLALDAQTGREIWSNVVGDASLGEYVSAAPLGWNGLVIAGVGGSEFGVRGRIIAYDALDGREIWRFDSVPVGNEPGARSWGNSNWALHGGGGIWSTFTLDPTTAELFAPIGNPVPDFAPGDRHGDNLYTNSALVLDARTGALRWWYQLQANDARDYDLGAAPLLFRNSQHESMMAVAGKDGLLHVVSRTTHKALYKVPVTTVDAQHKPLTTEGVRTCPGASGGVLWNGPAFDPKRMTLFVAALDLCMVLQTQPGQQYAPRGINNGGTYKVVGDTPTGWLTAVNADTGAIRWKYHSESPMLGGVTTTAGAVVLTGDNGGHFLAFDSQTGQVLLKVPTGGAIGGGVVTYERDGRQYVAVASGNVSYANAGLVGQPSIIILALPQSPAAAAKGTSHP
jgi:GntR family transcriptional regulator / MocR family aminotransferase